MSNHSEYSQTFEAHGHPFKLEVFHDPDAPAPWEMSDAHGPVRQIGPNDSMRPGERWLSDPHYGRGRVYDWEGAIKIALRDQWGHPQMISRPNLSAHQIAAAAVQADYEYLRGWVRDEWHYVGVCVTHEASGAHSSVWGIESNETAYRLTVANECAAEIITDPAFIAWRKLLADCERALDCADRLNDWADSTERKRIRYGINPARDRFCQDMRDAAELLRALAGN
jgi:hypothetical protein